MRRRVILYTLQVTLLFLIYFFTARFGLALDAVSGFATFVWIPTGLSLVVLFLGGIRLWPGVFLGALIVNFLMGAPLSASLGIGVGNTLEAIIGVLLLRRFGFDESLRRVRDIVLLIFLATFCSTVVSATFGVESLRLAGLISHEAVLQTWLTWWGGDIVSNLIIAPFLFVWSAKQPLNISLRKVLEGAFLLLAFLLVSVIIFFEVSGPFLERSPKTYLITPFLLWAALRFSQRTTASLLLLLSAIGISGTILGYGPFSNGMLTDNLWYLQGYLGIFAIISLLLCAVVWERRDIEERKDDFIRMASHELKTPITSLKLYAELLRRKPTDIKTITRFEDQIDKVAILVNDLLDISKITSGKLELHPELFDINQLVKDTVASVKLDNKKKKIQIQGTIKEAIWGDKVRIGEVLINLLTNAIKYSPHSHTIKVFLNDKGSAVSIGIKDFGIGIDQEHQNKIFERFYRVQQDSERSFPGLGIGLYISAEIIRRHGGKMTVESETGKGSLFTIILSRGNYIT